MTDPSCLYDAATQRFFVVVLTLETRPDDGAFTRVNHLDIAVSQTANPTGTLEHLPARRHERRHRTPAGRTRARASATTRTSAPTPTASTSRRTRTRGAATASTGAQIYAFSKAQLAAGAAIVAWQHIDTSGMVNAPSDAGADAAGLHGLARAVAGTGSFNTANGGTEYFMSSNAADEATHPVAGTGGSHTSNKIVVWTLTNTSSLNSASPALNLGNKVLA